MLVSAGQVPAALLYAAHCPHHAAGMKQSCMLSLLALVTGLFAAPRPNILFLIGDNWLYDHAGANGDPAVKTPVFDRISREGARFTHAFCPVPSCSPTRASLVTGRAAHQLADAASLWSKFDGTLRVFGDDLSASGYHVGFTGKGWSPGNYKDFGRTTNPAGKQFANLPAFLAARKTGQPFFYWLGSVHTALSGWKEGREPAAGIDAAHVKVPANLPDTPLVREEIADYLAAVQRMDTAFGEALAQLEELGELTNTIVIYTSDNGWQMPRGLANCYDTGTHVPFAVRWPGKVQPNRVVEDFISLTDLAPTFLELAGLAPTPEMTGRSFVDLLLGKPSAIPRDHVFLERERHANVRHGDLSYPIRAIRTREYLYIRNLRPDRWPAGDPKVHWAVGDYGDIDGSRTKQYMLDHRDASDVKELFALSFAKRPPEELYDLRTDPDQLRNVAERAEYAGIRQEARAKVDSWMRRTGDPRVDPNYDRWDEYKYYGPPAKGPARQGRRGPDAQSAARE